MYSENIVCHATKATLFIAYSCISEFSEGSKGIFSLQKKSNIKF